MTQKAPAALFLAGGWPNHQPEEVCRLFAEDLEKAGFSTRIETSLDILVDPQQLNTFDLIFPCWTMGTLSKEQSQGLLAAVRAGVGLGGVHGGMGDAFRGNLDYEWAVGGHFVGHPHVGDYSVRVTAVDHEITKDLPSEFPYHSEQYYMMVDPGLTVLAETLYQHDGKRCIMPVVWTKSCGVGRVFYSALGHQLQEFHDFPHVRQMTTRGLLWAAAPRLSQS